WGMGNESPRSSFPIPHSAFPIGEEMAYEKELAAALEAAAAAGRVILEAYATFTAIPNARADISTEADRQAQEAVLGHLRRVFPGDALCAEEQTPTLAAAAHTG